MSDKNMIFGRRPIIEAIRSGKTVDKLFVQKQFTGDLARELTSEAQHASVPVKRVPLEKLNRLTRKNHQGVVGFISAIDFSSIEHIVDQCFANAKDPFLLVLDGITDVRNFGAMVRTAECVGVDAVIIPDQGFAQISGDALKTSAGALTLMPICRTSNLEEQLTTLKNSGINIIACTEKTDTLLYEIEYRHPIAIVLGSEEMGISKGVLKLVDQRAKIPLVGKIKSLNVATSAGIILYEARRQRL